MGFESVRANKKAGHEDPLLKSNWRRAGDSNPRFPFGEYSLSRRAPSASRSALRNSQMIIAHFFLLEQYAAKFPQTTRRTLRPPRYSRDVLEPHPTKTHPRAERRCMAHRSGRFQPHTPKSPATFPACQNAHANLPYRNRDPAWTNGGRQERRPTERVRTRDVHIPANPAGTSDAPSSSADRIHVRPPSRPSPHRPPQPQADRQRPHHFDKQGNRRNRTQASRIAAHMCDRQTKSRQRHHLPREHATAARGGAAWNVLLSPPHSNRGRYQHKPAFHHLRAARLQREARHACKSRDTPNPRPQGEQALHDRVRYVRSGNTAPRPIQAPTSVNHP